MKKSLVAVALLSFIPMIKAEDEISAPQASQEIVAPVQEVSASEATTNQELSVPGDAVEDVSPIQGVEVSETNPREVASEVVVTTDVTSQESSTIGDAESLQGAVQTQETTEAPDSFTQELDNASDTMHEAGITCEFKPVSSWQIWLQNIGATVLVQYINLRMYLSKVWQSMIPAKTKNNDHVEKRA